MKAVAWFEDTGAAAAARAASAGLEVSIDAPDLGYVEPMTRRRLSRLARAILDCAGRCQTSAGDLRLVVASRHGEVARTLSLLEELAAGGELSPTAFSLSVHNATAGLLSIIRRNHAPIGAVGAGAETFAWGLLDAYATFEAAPGEPVLYLYGDDALPEAYADFSDTDDGLVAIGMLIAADAGRHLAIRSTAAAAAADTLSLPAAFTGAGEHGCWHGTRTSWEWRWDEARQDRHAH